MNLTSILNSDWNSQFRFLPSQLFIREKKNSSPILFENCHLCEIPILADLVKKFLLYRLKAQNLSETKPDFQRFVGVEKLVNDCLRLLGATLLEELVCK